MSPLPTDLQKLLQSPEASKLLGNQQALDALGKSAELQGLMQTLNAQSGGNLQNMAQAAMKGDPSQLAKLLGEVSSNPQAAKAVADLSKKLPK